MMTIMIMNDTRPFIFGFRVHINSNGANRKVGNLMATVAMMLCW